MIGFFDSGFGGLQTMKYFYQLYPDYDYIFLADTANCPYGEKSGEEIKNMTFKSLNWLFEKGAKIVILACNTAAAYSIRPRQSQFPTKKTLSITIPGIEEILEKDDIHGKVGVIATQATINSDIYNDLFHRFGGKINPEFKFIMAPELVDLVERGFENENENYEIVKKYTDKFGFDTKYLILGCTHFPILMKYFQENFKGSIIDPSREAAKKFGSYLIRHPEIEENLGRKQSINFFTSGDTESFDRIGERIRGNKIKSQKTII